MDAILLGLLAYVLVGLTWSVVMRLFAGQRSGWVTFKNTVIWPVRGLSCLLYLIHVGRYH